MGKTADVGASVFSLAITNRQVNDLQIEFKSAEKQVKIPERIEFAKKRPVFGQPEVVLTEHYFCSAKRIFDWLLKQPGKKEAEKMNLNFDYADSKTAVLDVESAGKIHRAVLTNDEEKVIVYESQELDYPKWGIYAVSLEEYLKTIRDVPWISKNLTDEDRELLQDLKNKEAEKND